MLEKATSGAERRRHPRTLVNMSLSCIRLDPDGGDVVDRIHIVDISRGGMGAMTDRPYYPGQRILLRLPLTESSGHRNIHATIVRCRQRSEGYRVGLAFDATAISAWSGASVAALAA